MNPLVVAPVLEIGKSLIDRFFPDKEAARKAESEMLAALTQADIQSALKQLEINAIEAAHPSIWVSGWRPFFGWVGGTAFAYVGVLQPLLAWLAAIKGWPLPPDIDTDFLWVVVSGLLGIGGLRTLEKTRRVTK